MVKVSSKLFQVILVFAVAAGVYLLTAAFVPYPGLSTDYLAALCFPGAADMLGAYKLDEWVLCHLIQIAGPDRMFVWCTCFSALCGALMITLLFLTAQSAVRLFCIDYTGIRSYERARAERDMHFIAHISGIGTVAIALTALPLWAMSTRLLPGTLTACAGMAFLALAVELRCRCAEDVRDSLLPSVAHRAMMGILFGGALFFATLSPTMLPVAIVGILFGGWVLILPRIDGRLSYFPWILGGLAAGLLFSGIVSTAWHALFNAETTLSPFILWAQGVMGAVPAIMGMVLNFDGAAPLVFFAAAAALFFGTFPRAFLYFGTPLIGQIGIVALFALSIARWPAEFWVLLSEPTPVAVLGMAFAVLLFALLVGAWAKHLLDSLPRWSASRAHFAAMTVALCFFGCLMLLLGGRNMQDGSGISARRALGPIRETMNRLLPEACTVWIDPPQNASLFLVQRYADGRPVCPVRKVERMFERLQLKGKPFADCCAEDPVLAELAALGGDPLLQYLRFSDWGAEVVTGSLAVTRAAQVEAIAARVAATDFGETVVGERLVRTLSRRAAATYAAQALRMPDAQAAELLQRAKTLDPENPGILLSLGALTETGYPVSQADALLALKTVEENPWLRAPTLAQAHAFEQQYGPVRSEVFRAAKRLRDFLENPEENVAAIAEAYRAAPDRLSDRERVIALLSLGEEEILSGFEGREPSRTEIEAYLCFYLRTERAMACYKRYEALLKENDALSVLYRNRGRIAADRLHEKAYAFFARDGYFPYAYVYLLGLLRSDDPTEAAAFVSGFSFRDHLRERPCLAEELRVRVLKRIEASDPSRAVTLARDWLQKEPLQPRLWTFLLNRDSALEPELLAADVRAALRHYPLHPLASTAFAAELTRLHGPDAAARWTQSVVRARAEVVPSVETK